MTSQELTIAQEFINKELFGVISTNSESGYPESAVVAFALTHDWEIIIATENTSRKFKNIEKNPKISFVIGWDPANMTTVQIEGVAHVLSNIENEKYKKILFIKHPSSQQFENDPDERYICINVEWMKYSNYFSTSVKVIEHKF